MTRLFVCAVVLCAWAAAAPGAVVYVDDDAPPGGDGTSWASAYRHPYYARAALAALPVNERELRIAGGVYDKSIPENFIAVVLPAGTDLRGGHAGFGAPDPDAVSGVLHPTSVSFAIAIERGQADGEGALPLVEIENLAFLCRTERYRIGRDTFFGSLAVPENDLVVTNCVFDGQAECRSSFLVNYQGSYTPGEQYTTWPSVEIRSCTFRNGRTPQAVQARLRLGCESLIMEDCVFDDAAPIRQDFNSIDPFVNTPFAAMIHLASLVRAQSAIVRRCDFRNNSSHALLIAPGLAEPYSARRGMSVLVEDCLFERNDSACMTVLGPPTSAYNAAPAIEPGPVELVLRDSVFLDCVNTARSGPDTQMIGLRASEEYEGETYASRIELSGLRFDRCERDARGLAGDYTFDGNLVYVLGDRVEFTDNAFFECRGLTTIGGYDPRVDRCSWVSCSAPETTLLYATNMPGGVPGLLSGVLFAGNTVFGARDGSGASLASSNLEVRGVTAVGNWFLPFQGDATYPPGDTVAAEFIGYTGETFDTMSSVLAANLELDGAGIRPAFGFAQGHHGTSYVENSTEPYLLKSLFFKPFGSDNVPYSGDENWKPSSKELRDRGNSSLAPAADLTGAPRVCDGGNGCLVDIGAVEGFGPTCACPADLTTTLDMTGGVPDGVVDGADLSYFVESWLDGESVADMTTLHANPDHPGFGSPDGRVDGADLAYFVEAWLNGCAA